MGAKSGYDFPNNRHMKRLWYSYESDTSCRDLLGDHSHDNSKCDANEGSDDLADVGAIIFLI